jgi:ankyrin repeat protein
MEFRDICSSVESLHVYTSAQQDINHRYSFGSLASLVVLWHDPRSEEEITFQKLQFLIDRGIDLEIKNEDGLPALDLAATGGFINITKFLLSRGANPNTINNFGETLVHSMIHDLEEIPNGREILNMLLDYGGRREEKVCLWCNEHHLETNKYVEDYINDLSDVKDPGEL